MRVEGRVYNPLDQQGAENGGLHERTAATGGSHWHGTDGDGLRKAPACGRLRGAGARRRSGQARPARRAGRARCALDRGSRPRLRQGRAGGVQYRTGGGDDRGAAGASGVAPARRAIPDGDLRQHLRSRPHHRARRAPARRPRCASSRRRSPAPATRRREATRWA